MQRSPSYGASVRLIAIVLAALAIVPYLQTLGHDFVNYDDNLYVTSNRIVQKGLTLEGVRYAFTTFESGNWHPITWLSHMLDCTLFGLDAGKHHLINIIIHAVNTLLLFALFLGTTGAAWRSTLVASLFAVHPLHVESVAWVAERKDVLSTMFGLLSMLAYVRFTRDQRVRWYMGTLLLFVLSLLCKPMLVTLPCLLLLIDIWPLRRWTRAISTTQIAGSGSAGPPSSNSISMLPRLVAEKAPMALISAAFAAVAIISQSSSRTMLGLERLHVTDRLANAVVAYVEYLNKAFLPVRLAVFYPHPGQVSPTTFAICGAILAAITFVVIAWRRSLWLAVGWFWYLGLLVPVIGLVQVGSQAMADRYMYLPIVGIFIMIAWSLPGAPDRTASRLLAAAAGAVVIALALMTWTQVTHWRNSRTLFSHALALTSDNYLAHQNLGSALEREGNLDAALEQYQRSASIQPNSVDVHVNIANLLLRKGQFAQARQEIDAALRLDPESAAALNSLGVVFLSAQQPEDAVEALSKSARIDPNNLEARGNLGVALFQVSRIQDAINEFSAILEIEPRRHDIRTNRAIALAQVGRYHDALAELRDILGEAPEFQPARTALEILIESGPSATPGVQSEIAPAGPHQPSSK